MPAFILPLIVERSTLCPLSSSLFRRGQLGAPRAPSRLQCSRTRLRKDQSVAATPATATKSSQTEEQGTRDEANNASHNQTAPGADAVASATVNPIEDLAEERLRGMQEYEELKGELLRVTGIISALGSAYCFLGYSPQTCLSYALGCLFSVVYLLELIKSADSASRESVPKVFQGRLPRRNNALSNFANGTLIARSPQRFLQGIRLGLTSPRLLLPTFLMLAWVASRVGSGGDPDIPHLQLAPLLLGFFAYKAAVLAVGLKDQADDFEL